MKKYVLTIRARSSAKVIDSQTPSSLRMIGRMERATSWKTRVLKNDMIADTMPLLRAVKKDDANML